jgi:outer membrane cobalamin receptor
MKNPKHVVLLLTVFVLGMCLPLAAQQTRDLMEMSLEELMNLTITTAGKTEEKISDVPASVVVVTRKDIEKYGYQSLSEVLQSVPGLYYTYDYSKQNFGMRGFWTVDALRNIIVLVNDVPQTEGVFGAHFIDNMNIPVEAIDRIEVVRGPMSVMYGTGAFFGAINIKTNMIENDPVSRVSVSYGSENTKQIMARASGKEGDFQYAFNAALYGTDGLNKSLEEMAGPAYAGLTTGGQMEQNNNFFSISGKFKGFFVDVSFTESDNEWLFLMPSFSDGTDTKTATTRFTFGYQNKVSRALTLDARLLYYSFEQAGGFDWLMPNLLGDQVLGNRAYNAEAKLYYNPSPRFGLTAGLNYVSAFGQENKIVFPLLGYNYYLTKLNEGDKWITQSVFAQMDWKISDRFKVVAGARLEQMPEVNMEALDGKCDPADPNFGTTVVMSEYDYSFTDIVFIPRLALLYSPGDAHTIKLMYGKAINRPSFFQLSDFQSSASYKLTPELIHTLELNYIGVFSPKISMDLSFFRNMLDDLLYRTQILVGSDYYSWYANVGEMTTNGVELTINTRPSDKLAVDISGTYQDTKESRPGVEDTVPGFSPKLLGYLNASYFFNKDISLAVTGNYVDAMEAYLDATVDPVARTGDKVDGYFLLGANLRFRNLFGSGLYLNIRGSNLLDTEVRYPNTSNSVFTTKGLIGRGRTILATVGWDI